ncbi:MAG TPA: hypothetical protein VGN44_05665 [Candidatus Angelobacter sp.]
MVTRANSKPKAAKTRRRKFLPDDNPVWLKAQVKFQTWKRIEALAGPWGMGYGLDCLHDLLLQREAEVIMLTSMLAANLPKVKPEAMAEAHALGQISVDQRS